ncbi:MAG: TadE/TadG family type IV pilus assembly protein [Anaerolineaceae bacterium]|nr:TadE/TadG family type IV pilus assembly protein [Anaerolineaceae bacterium]
MKWVNLPESHQDMYQSKAQGMVEFALALPIFLLLMFGVIEFGRLFLTYSAVYSASREAARYGAAAGLNLAGTPRNKDCAGIRAAAVRVGSFGGVTTSQMDIWYDTGPRQVPIPRSSLPSCPANTNLGDRILVEVWVQYRPIVPLVRLPTLTIRSTAARTMLQKVEVGGVPPTPIPTPTTFEPLHSIHGVGYG